MTLKPIKKNSPWFEGTTTINDREYKVQMMRFDEPSEYGINDGRISKLFIFDKHENLVWFDRGWDIPATSSKTINLLNEIVKEYN